MVKRPGTKFIKEFPADNPIVSTAIFKDNLYVATQKMIYMLVDEKLVPLDIVEKELT